MSTIVSIPLETEETRSVSSEQGINAVLEEDLQETTEGRRERRVLVCYQQPAWAASPKRRG